MASGAILIPPIEAAEAMNDTLICAAQKYTSSMQPEAILVFTSVRFRVAPSKEDMDIEAVRYASC